MKYVVRMKEQEICSKKGERKKYIVRKKVYPKVPATYIFHSNKSRKRLVLFSPELRTIKKDGMKVCYWSV